MEAFVPVEKKPKLVADMIVKPHFDIGASGKFVLVVAKLIKVILKSRPSIQRLADYRLI